MDTNHFKVDMTLVKIKIVIIFFITAGFFCTEFTFADVTPECPPLTIFSDVTDSGIKTYVVEIPRSPVVSIKIYFRGGAFGENEKRGSGLAYAVQSILFEKLTKEFSESEDTFTKLNSETYYDAISFSAVSLKNNLPLIIKKFGREICGAKFSKHEWKTIRYNLINQILFEKNNPWQQLDLLFRRTAFIWDPVKFSIKGNLSLFNDLSCDDLISFYKKYFVADNLVVVVAGDVNPENVSFMVKKAFADLPETSGVLPEKFDSPMQTAPRWFEQHGAVTQSYVSIGFSTADVGHPDLTALHLLPGILKREELEKLLGQNTENFVGLKISLLSLPGSPDEFVITFSCDENSAARAARSVEKYMFNLVNCNWDKATIERQRLKSFTDYLSSVNSPEFIIELVGKSALRLGNPHYPEINAKHLMEITSQKLTEICKKYFVLERLSVAILSPERGSDEFFGMQKEQLLRGERALLGETHFPVRRITLKNGVKIILRRIPDAQVVNFVFAGLGGLWCEDESINGAFSVIAEIMQSLKYKKPNKYFFQKKEEEDNLNIYPKAKSNEQIFTLDATVIPQHALKTAKKLCRVWASPELNEQNVSAATSEILKKLETQVTNISQLADIAFRASLFALQPYRLNSYGNQLSLPLLSVKTVSDIYNDFITPMNTMILVSGNFDEKEMENVIEISLENFQKKGKSSYFINHSSKYKLHSKPPVFVVDLPPEIKVTNQFTRVFSSPNPEAVVICGIRAPGINSTNYPIYATKIIRAALLNQIENLKAKWIDFQKRQIVRSFNVVDFQGYNTGWIYAYCILPKENAREGSARLSSIFSSTISGLSDGKYLKKAIPRADFESEFSNNKNFLKTIVVSELFALPEISSSVNNALDNISLETFRQLFNQYGKDPVSTIIMPQK